jgi:hypothetical protein
VGWPDRLGRQEQRDQQEGEVDRETPVQTGGQDSRAGSDGLDWEEERERKVTPEHAGRQDGLDLKAFRLGVEVHSRMDQQDQVGWQVQSVQFRVSELSQVRLDRMEGQD